MILTNTYIYICSPFATAIIKRIYMGEFQIGAVIMWELSTLPQWSYPVEDKQ